MNWVWTQWLMPRLLEHWDAEEPEGQDLELAARLQVLAKAMRVPVPALYLVSDYSPYAFMIAPYGVRSQLVLYRGLLQLLTGAELDAVFCHLLAQQRFASFRWAPWIILPSYGLATLFGFLPAISRSLLYYGPLAFLRGILQPQRFLQVDQEAVLHLGEVHSFVAALQKSAVLAQKLKPRVAHWSWDFLSWISSKDSDLSLLRTHPVPETRAQALLELHS